MDDIKFPDDETTEDSSEDDVMQDIETDDDSDEISEDDFADLDEELKDEIDIDKPAGRVAITFGRFVKLVANHSYLDVVERNTDEEVTMSTNLLTDLANAHDRQTERKLPIVFLVGIVLGVAVTYFLLTR